LTEDERGVVEIAAIELLADIRPHKWPRTGHGCVMRLISAGRAQMA
jgi:hypothetical protein